jgi:hypothetical protein
MAAARCFGPFQASLLAPSAPSARGLFFATMARKWISPASQNFGRKIRADSSSPPVWNCAADALRPGASPTAVRFHNGRTMA